MKRHGTGVRFPAPPSCFAPAQRLELRRTRSCENRVAGSGLPCIAKFCVALAKQNCEAGFLRIWKERSSRVCLSPTLKAQSDQRYVGITKNLKNRLSEHNAGKSPHTSKYAPWELVVAVCFADQQKAEAFEQYLKHGSGHAFANRHFW